MGNAENNTFFLPPQDFVDHALVKSRAEYEAMWKQSVEDPDTFWGNIAENLTWFKPWVKVYRGDYSIGDNEWFIGGKTNITYNCLDVPIANGKGDKTALLFQGEPDEDCRHISYSELLKLVCRFANVLKKHGVQKGDRVILYMPMVWQLPVAMLACARIGAVHTVVFGGFSAEALRDRILGSGAKMVITVNGYWRSGKQVGSKATADQACAYCLEEGLTVDHMIVINRLEGFDAPVVPGRDLSFEKEMAAEDISDECAPVVMDAQDPLFIMFTSGSTGKPKGTLHANGGYMVYAYATFKYIFDIKDTDIFFCTADIGWVTGHTYAVYGPLLNGATSIIYESVPTYPEPDRFWQIVDKHKATIFYTAPTVIRSLMKKGEEWVEKHDLSSLRLLGSVGEPINPEAWLWYHKYVGHGKCPLVDTWWQTEGGGILITALPGAWGLKPGSATLPFFGIKAIVLKPRPDGNAPAEEAAIGEEGELCLESAWPGMMRAVYGEPDRFYTSYFTQQPGYYFTGDGAKKDEDGYFWLLGRIDDVVNISGHRIGTVEVETALCSHPAVVEAAVVGYPHPVKGDDLYAYVILGPGVAEEESLKKELINHVRKEIGPIASPGKVQFIHEMPKNRSGKIVRRVLRKIAAGDAADIGDAMISTLADPSVVDTINDARII